jgi:hypothetical protein
VAPKFSINQIKVSRNSTNVTLTYNFLLDDLGGSSPASGWNKSYYSTYNNFERSISGYSKKIALKIDISDKENFSGAKTGYTSYSSSTSFVNFLSKECSVGSIPTTWTKLYIRFTLIASYGLNSSNTDSGFAGLSTVVSLPYTFTYAGEVPVVSHRPHMVGINAQQE